MTHRETKFIEIFLIVLFISVGAIFAIREINHDWRDRLYSKTESGIVKHPAQQIDKNILKDYQSVNPALSFKYPQNISVTQSATSGLITLNHNIPFPNHGDCDMKGDEKTYPTLNDFNVTMEIKKGTVAQVVKKLSPYMPAGNFSGNTLKASPGFIDPVTIGPYSGFSIYEGAEGCGWTVYYFPLNDGRVLVVKKDMVQYLSGIVGDEIKKQILKVPGAMTSEQSGVIFKQIIESLRIEGIAAGWKTYKNSQYGFEFQYPEGWFIRQIDNTWDTQSVSFDKNLHGVGDPPSGMWVHIAYGNCLPHDNWWAGPGALGSIEKTVCKDNFEISENLYNDDPQKADHERILKTISESFKLFTK